MAQLAVTASPAWTDHNVPDPGVTLLEAAAFGIADMHYRLESAGFAQWPLGWDGTLDSFARHWSGGLPEPGAGGVAALATALKSALALPGESLEARVADAPSRADAESVFASAPFATLVPPAVRSAATSALRWRLLRRIALEHADVIADAVTQTDGVPGGSADKDAAAALEVQARTGVWTEEAVALVTRERRRRRREVAAIYQHSIDTTDEAGYGALLTTLTDHGLSAAEARAAAARPRVPVGIAPEDLEEVGGATRVWPPHPLQALACEPVTADDYARRARSHPDILRAWTVSGRLAGITWSGVPTPTSTELASYAADDVRRSWTEDVAASALTIVVQPRVSGPMTDNQLRAVLAHAIGSEAHSALPSWRDSYDPLDPRRLVCDEVGIAPLRFKGVEIRATLRIPPTAVRSVVTALADASIDAYFARGREETYVAEAASDPLAGPWPPAPQPRDGWVPGTPIPVSEVVQQLVSVPDVIAVEELKMRTGTSDTSWVGGANGLLTIPPGHVPLRNPIGCFTIELQVAGACDG
jgi:hypothetical protein